jgi:hypothetical protein
LQIGIADCRLAIEIADWRLNCGLPIEDWASANPNRQSSIRIGNRQSESAIVNPNRQSAFVNP